jgi:succinate dehydrogenase/fumarate reductase flavoprotein subunit
MLECSLLMTRAALMRTESRGAHYRTDFPGTDDKWLKHIVFQKSASEDPETCFEPVETPYVKPDRKSR